MRFRTGPLGPLLIAVACTALTLGTAAPAHADDPPAPERAVPVGRGAVRAVPSGGYEQLVGYAAEISGELTALEAWARDAQAERDRVAAELDAIAAATEHPATVRDRLLRQALRLSARPAAAPLPGLSSAQREAVIEMRGLRAALEERHAALRANLDSVAADLVAPPATRMRAPAQGELTQGFGPTAFDNFHEGIDIANAMYTDVVAAAPGRVVFAGRMADGAMVVLIAHVGGLVTLYAHLDDVIAPLRVRTGDRVDAGQVIGSIGMTGMTTGPHLHFVMWRDGALVDPLSIVDL